MEEINELITELNKVSSIDDFIGDKDERANLKELQNQSNAEVKKATTIREKLNTLSL